MIGTPTIVLETGPTSSLPSPWLLRLLSISKVVIDRLPYSPAATTSGGDQRAARRGALCDSELLQLSHNAQCAGSETSAGATPAPPPPPPPPPPSPAMVQRTPAAGDRCVVAAVPSDSCEAATLSSGRDNTPL